MGGLFGVAVVVTVIVGVACLYMVAANFVDFARAYPALRPKPRA